MFSLFVCLFVFAAVVLSLKEVGVEVEVEAGVEVIWLEATASRIARQVTNRKSACISGSAFEPHLSIVLERGGWVFAFEISPNLIELDPPWHAYTHRCAPHQPC